MCAKVHHFFGFYKHYKKFYTDKENMKEKGEAFASPSELRRPDSNRRPLGYEPNELPTAPLRDVSLISSAKVRAFFITSKYFWNIF